LPLRVRIPPYPTKGKAKGTAGLPRGFRLQLAQRLTMAAPWRRAAPARTLGKAALKIERLVSDVRDYAKNPRNASGLDADTLNRVLAPLTHAAGTLRAGERGENSAAVLQVLRDTSVTDLAASPPPCPTVSDPAADHQPPLGCQERAGPACRRGREG
jgi:hypothetical protein